MDLRVPAVALALLAISTVAYCQAKHPTASAHDVTYAEAKPVLDDFSDDLPEDLRGLTPEQRQARWPKYVREQDLSTRDRLLQGDEDSLVNLLLFGTSFTAQPRLTSEYLAKNGGTDDASKHDTVTQVLNQRVTDLIAAIGSTGANERLRYMRSLLVKRGYHLETAEQREKVRSYLLAGVARVHTEFAEFSRQLAEARKSGNPDLEFSVRSTLYKKRGISLDTSIMPDFALEEALKELLRVKLFAKGGVRRVAVIGPGLDFTDKSEGFDFYPQQTTQPFLLLDSLVRLGLSRADEVEITTLDISARVNEHISAMRSRATASHPYEIQLPLRGDKTWSAGAHAFWQNAGSAIATAIPPVAVPASEGKLEIRALRIAPATVLRINPRDENVVWQRIDLPADDKYDLIVATNILVYYDEFHQALALDNLQAMLKPGGILLTNDGLPDVQTLDIHQIGGSSTVYSDQQSDGDQIIWYQYRPR